MTGRVRRERGRGPLAIAALGALGIGGLVAGCSGSGGGASPVSGTSPTSPAAPTAGAPGAPAAAPGDPGAGGAGAAPVSSASGAFTIDMPMRASDAGGAVNTVWPFGVHGADHGADGHPGFDLEYAVGADVLAAADGVVLSITADGSLPGAFTVQVSHHHATGEFRTVYGHLGAMAAGIRVGADVKAGQPLAPAFPHTQMIGSGPVTFASIHFQLDDFSKNDGITNPNAICPLDRMSGPGRAVFDAVWSRAQYRQELYEPFPGNPRGASFPLTRTWTRRSGALAARLVLRQPAATSGALEYTLVDDAGVALEAGTVVVDPIPRPPTIDLTPTAAPGQARLGVYEVTSGAMKLTLGAPGAARVTSLAGASEYETATP